MKVLVIGIGLLLVLLIALFGLYYLINLRRVSQTSVSGAQEKDEIITVRKIIKDPVVYNDLPVSVRGKIVDWVTKRAFVIEDTESSGSILVLHDEIFELPQYNPDDEPALGEETKVDVAGVVRIFDFNNSDVGFDLDLEEKELKRWDKRPIIVASEVKEVTP